MNPIIRKGIRERLRPKHLLASALFSLIIAATVYLSAYLDGMQEKKRYDYISKTHQIIEENPVNGARNAFTYLLGFQGFLLMFLGTGRVASVTAEEKELGLLDYQRMTPMHPFSKVTGYLFGLPAREYFMFLLTLPFLLHCVVVGRLPWLDIFQLYTVFFSSVILYHLTAHVIGLVVPRPRAASWVSRIAVLGLYIFLPGLGQAGVSFLSFLTILPTYFGKILPSLSFVGENKLGRFEAKAFEFWQDVPFFTTSISPSAFTFFMQSLLILTLCITAYRKWRNHALPAFSKPSALLLYGIFQFLLLGCLWMFFTEGKAIGLLGESFSLHKLGQPDPYLALIVVQSIFYGLSILVILPLLNICCPNQHLYLKGMQRSEKLSLAKIPMGADERSGCWLALALSALTIFTHFIFATLIEDSALWNAPLGALDTVVIPGLFLVSMALYLQASRELWFNLGFWGFIGLLWFTPLLMSLVVAVGWSTEHIGLILKLQALCPLSLLPLHLIAENSSFFSLDQNIQESIREAVWFGLSVSIVLSLLLQFKLRRSRK
jgi:hypothetical protein